MTRRPIPFNLPPILLLYFLNLFHRPLCIQILLLQKLLLRDLLLRQHLLNNTAIHLLFTITASMIVVLASVTAVYVFFGAVGGILVFVS